MTEPYLLLSLTVPPRLEESITDWLLGSDAHYGFTTFPVSGHSAQPGHLTLPEQVSGRKQNVRFEMCLPPSDVDRLVAALRSEFADTGVVYWVTPVMGFGGVDSGAGAADRHGG